MYFSGAGPGDNFSSPPPRGWRHGEAVTGEVSYSTFHLIRPLGGQLLLEEKPLGGVDSGVGLDTRIGQIVRRETAAEWGHHALPENANVRLRNLSCYALRF
jgi:hypothetical protein